MGGIIDASMLLAVFVSTLAGIGAALATVFVLISTGTAASLATRGKEIVANLQGRRYLEAYSQPGNPQQADRMDNHETLHDEAATTSMTPTATREFSSADQVLDAVRSLDDWCHLPLLLEQTKHLEVFHHAAMLNDLLFFSIVFCRLPRERFAEEMKRRNNTNAMTVIECCDGMFPELASRIKYHLKRQQQITSPHLGDDASTMTFDQVVGNKQVIATLQRNIAAMKKDPTSPMNMQPILLYGPPGTGKSYLATCCAVEMKAPAIEIKCQDALNSKLGESEKIIAQQFDLAASSQPKAVLIINEFESLCRRNKSSESAEWTATIRKCFIDIFDNLRNPAHEYFGVKVLLTTNFVDEVDAAVVDRVEKIEVPLPSEAEIAQLLPMLCKKHISGLHVSQVNWEKPAELAHCRLSVRGLKDALEKGYRQLLEIHGSPVATTELVCTWMRQQIGKVAPEPLKQPENFRCVQLTQMAECEKVALATCLARAGWRFDSTPSHVYRQIFSLDDVNEEDVVLILRKTSTGELFSGIGCYATLMGESASDFGFKSCHVYVQCTPEDAERELCARTTSLLLESYGQTGMRCFNWEYDTKFENLGPPEVMTPVESFLAPLMKRFVRQRVYIETRSMEVLCDQKLFDISKKLLIYAADFSKWITGDKASLLIGKASSPKMMSELGYRVFMMAESPKQLVSSDVNVLYASQYDDGKALRKMEVEAGQIVVCEQSGATVADALRRNGIHYAALQGVFVRRGIQPTNSSYRGELYAAPTIPGKQKVIWTGDALADFENLPSFRAKYALFSPCTSARQVLDQGVGIMVDTQKINELPTPERPLAIALLRLYPEPANGRVIRDLGFEDEEKNTRGFRRGWYRGGYYWRIVGNTSDVYLVDAYLAGGTLGNPYEKVVRKRDNLGFVDTGIMVDIPGHGTCFCRGVGNNASNPEMACVLFDSSTDAIQSHFAFQGLLGTWKDICQ